MRFSSSVRELGYTSNISPLRQPDYHFYPLANRHFLGSGVCSITHEPCQGVWTNGCTAATQNPKPCGSPGWCGACDHGFGNVPRAQVIISPSRHSPTPMQEWGLFRSYFSHYGRCTLLILPGSHYEMTSADHFECSPWRWL